MFEATHLRLTIAVVLFAVGGCGGKLGSSSVDSGAEPSASADEDSGAPTIGFTDASTSSDFDGSPGFSPVADGPNDVTPACSSRSDFYCECRGENCVPGANNALGDLTRDCAGVGSACGYVYVDFDSSGCATALRMDQPNAAFVACLTKQLDSVRWTCAASTDLPGGEARAYVDCTTRGH